MAAGLDNGIVQAVSGENVMRKARAFIKYTILFTRQRKPTAFKFWRLPMTDGVCSTGLAGFNNRLHSDRFPAASRLQTGA